MSDRIMNSRKTRRRLAPSEKYEIFVSVLTGQATQREAAEKWKVDRCTVVHICRTARQGALDALPASVPGRPGMTAGQAALVQARAELERLRATVTEQAGGAAPARGKSRLGLTAGPVPWSRPPAGSPRWLLTRPAVLGDKERPSSPVSRTAVPT
jgi:transposase-like protein